LNCERPLLFIPIRSEWLVPISASDGYGVEKVNLRKREAVAKRELEINGRQSMVRISGFDHNA
jgi:hypothetical protein